MRRLLMLELFADCSGGIVVTILMKAAGLNEGKRNDR